MLERLGEAIEELAEALRGQAGGVSAGDLARVWALLAELDPAVAARLPGYSGNSVNPGDPGHG
jgi:hypothetical protein